MISTALFVNANNVKTEPFKTIYIPTFLNAPTLSNNTNTTVNRYVLRNIMFAPINLLEQNKNIELDNFDTNNFQEIADVVDAEINYIPTNLLIDIEEELPVIFENQFATFNVNADLYRDPLLINPSFGCSVNSTLYEYEMNNNLSFQIYAQPRIYLLNYEADYISGAVDSENIFQISTDNMSYFSSEINLGLVVQSGDFSIEYSRTADMTQIGEIEIAIVLN